jgi:radical SAM protein with 4Fe4S-binding SPASM domain
LKDQFVGSVTIDEFDKKKKLVINPDTYEIFDLLDQKVTIGQCADMLAKRYDLDKAGVIKTVNRILEEFIDNGMISLQDSPPAGETPKVPDCLRLNHHFSLDAVAVNLLAKCNLKCLHCYGESGITRKEKLAKETVFSIIDQLKELHCSEINFTGGEVFLYQDLFDILAYARRKNFKVALMTNGTLVTPGIVKRLKKIGHMEIQVSIDGTTAEIHDLFRGVKGSFKKSMRALKMLKEAGFSMDINFVAHKKNCDSLPAMHNLADGIGTKLSVDPLIRLGNAVRHLDDFYIEPDIYYDVYRKLRKNRSSLGNDSANNKGKKNRPEKYIERCSAGATSIAIKANGDVLPCEIFPQIDKFIMGNIYKTSLEEIVYNFDREKRIADFNALNLKKCKNCELIAECAGGCMVVAYVESGSFNELDPFTCARFRALNGIEKQN